VTIGTRALTVSANAQSMTYGNAVPTLTYAISGAGLANGDTLSGALTTAASSTSNVGAYAISQGTLAASSNYSVTYVGNNVAIGTRAITVSAYAQSMAYGDAVPTLTYAVGGAGLANSDTLSGALATSATSTSNVGSYAITQGTLAASSNYAVTYSGNSLAVVQRALTVTANAQSMAYGNAVPSLTYTTGGAGLVNGDTLSGALVTSASSTSVVGAYGITQGTLAASSNYALTYVGANVTIGQRALNVAANAQSMTYGNAVPGLTYAIGGAGLINGDTLTGALASAASSTANVGTYAITQGTLAAPSNYALTYTGANVTIGQRALTITADAQNMTYGNSVPGLTYTTGGAGLINGDTLSGALTTSASSTSNVGIYAIAQGTLAASSNYAVTYTGNNVTIGQRALTVTADAQTMTYGNSVPGLTYTTGGAGLVNGDTVSGALATTASSTANVGTYGITQGTIAASSNYALTYVGSNVTINTRAIAVTADAKTMSYGDSVPTLTYTIGGSGLVNGDTLTGALATTASSTANIGTYNITQGTLAASSNYALTYNSDDVTIGQRILTLVVTADAQSMVYGDAVPTLGYVLGGSGLVNGDTLSGALATTATSTSDVGTYLITRGTLTASSNYAFDYTAANFTVTARPLTIAADAKAMAYGNAVPSLTYTVGGAGLANGDALSGALTTSVTSTSSVGAYGITQGTLAASSNYAVTYTGANVTVGQRAITITADAATMTYGNATPSLTYTTGGAGLINGDTLSGALTTTASSTSNVGSYGITQGTLAASANYAITYSGANVTVGMRALTIGAFAQNMTYGNAVPTLTYATGGAGLVNGDTLSGALTTTASSTASVGNYGIAQGSLTAGGNYAITYTGNTVTIGQRALSVAANSQTMAYGNAVPSLSYTTGGAGLVNGDTLSGALATTASSTANIGTYGITQGTLAASSNYAVTYTGNNVTIGTRALTITANSQTMAYGNAVPTLTYTTSGGGLVNGDTLSGVLTTTATPTSNVGSYGITQGTLAASSNYAVTYTGNNVTIGQRALTVTADAKAIAYGDAVPTLSYVIGGSGLVNGDTLSGALTTTATPASNVGAYGITQGTLAASSNYALTYTSNNVTIGQRALSINADAQTMTYGNAVPSLTYTTGGAGLVNGDTLSGALTTTASSTANVGTYAIGQGSLAASGNYAVTYTGANVAIGQRALSIAANSQTMTYGNAVPTLTYTTGGAGLFNGDTLSGTLATTASSTTNVGTYGITQGTLAASSNYAVTYTGNNIMIGTRSLTIAANSQTMTYGNAVPTLTYTTGGAGLVNGDTLSGALATTASSSANIGTYGITQGTLAASSNYAVSYSGNNVTIGQRALTVAANSQTMTYGNAVPTLTYTTGGAGLVNGDTLSGTLATTASSTTNIGTYGITQGTLAASSNYAVTYTGSSVVIGTRALTVAANSQTMAYGDAVPTLSYTIGGSGLANGDTLSGALVTSATSTSNVGTYGITQGTLAASSNYALTFVGSNVTIGQRALTVAANAQTMTYGNAVPSSHLYDRRGRSGEWRYSVGCFEYDCFIHVECRFLRHHSGNHRRFFELRAHLCRCQSHRYAESADCCSQRTVHDLWRCCTQPDLYDRRRRPCQR